MPQCSSIPPTPVVALPAARRTDEQLAFEPFPAIPATAGLTRSLGAERQQETRCQGQPLGQGASPTPSGAQMYPVSLPPLPAAQSRQTSLTQHNRQGYNFQTMQAW